MLQRRTTLSAHVVAFSKFLRMKGFKTSPDHEAVVLQALAEIPPTKETVRLVFKSIFPKNQGQFLAFDALYDTYWKEVEKGVDAKLKTLEEESSDKKTPKKEIKKQTQAGFEALKNWLFGNNKEETDLAAFSTNESLVEKDFSTYTDEDLRKSERLIALLIKQLIQKKSRRFSYLTQSGTIALRQTLRKNFRHGDEILTLIYKKPKPSPIRFVLLCDVSESMEIYSRFFVQFMYAFQQSHHRIETFVFSTSLQRISEELKENSFQRALTKIAERMPAWGSGTQIGISLVEFLEKYAFRYLDKKTIVWIVSDGLDTGETQSIKKAMRLIKKQSKSIVWLNPLASNPAYKPEAQAMKEAMPFIDTFASGHSIESLGNVMNGLRFK